MLRRMIAGGAIGLMIALYLILGFERSDALLVGAGWDGHGLDGYSLYMMVNWLILFLPAWLCGLWQYENELLRANIVLYRYCHLMVWHVRTCAGVFLSVLFSYLCMGTTLTILYQLEWNGLLMQSLLLITLHCFGLMAITMGLRLLTGSMIISTGVIVILEGIGKMLAVCQLLPPVYNYFTWGMIVYNSSMYGNRGYDIRTSVIIQLLLISGLVLFGVGRMKVLVLRRITNAKNH